MLSLRCTEYWSQSVEISLIYLFIFLFVEERIQYKFENRFLLQQAVTHPSYKENFGTNPDHIRLIEWKNRLHFIKALPKIVTDSLCTLIADP
jgi:hypothetical protein